MIRRIDKILFRAIVPPFLSALVVLTFVVFVREFGRLSELLVTRNASPEVIGIIACAILPAILIYTLPLSFLIGNLIGLSGLSGESQIVALRACGVPLRSLVRPVLFLGAIVGIFTGILSTIILPETNDIFFSLKDRISLRSATSQIQPRVFNVNFANVVIYLDDIATDRQRWSRVFLSDSSDPKSRKTVLARDGTWVTDSEANRLQLHLEHGTIYEVDPENPSKDKLSVFAATDIPIELSRGSSGDSDQLDKERHREVFELSMAELWRGSPGTKPEERLKQDVELHRRLALPFSILGFSLVGLTLGVSTKKGGRTSGFVLSLLLVIFFYVSLMNGLRLATIGKIPSWLGAYSADILLAFLGFVFRAAAERGSRFFHRLSEWASNCSLGPFGKQLHLDAARIQILRVDEAIVHSTARFGRLRFPRILDVYVSRGFFAYFLWSTVSCAALFVILTLFDLLNDIIRNQISITYVANYFFFLLPQILMLVVPIAILLATLINFGILEKSSEVTALKAGGWSLYRISVPVFLMTAGLCFGLYFVQDYILPYANIRQDSIRNIIKKRPAQSSILPQGKWIFGESNRVYNYDYFDASQNLFIGLNIFEIDLKALRMLRRFHAARARIDNNGKWVLEDGWVRDFQTDKNSFQKITQGEFRFPEKAAYFQKEILEPKESSKLTYLELKDYINYLRKAGYNATELQVELYKKISFPLSCIVMALVGIPFSFSMGRKGAFFGIAISLSIAMSYWGVFSVFEKMGAYGLLIPLLAAWAPNILFGAAGLVLLFTIRT
jgi:LPS export ABC transporter permease LptG/LPS export ABC transporter permease LptF